MKVGVLMGGPSSEREVSLLSGNAIHSALKREGYDSIAMDIREDAYDEIKGSQIDVAFLALHGRFGEDGTIQAMLEEMGIPYVGSGPEASRLGMDKVASRKIFEQHGIPVPKYTVLRKDSSRLQAPGSQLSNLKFPLVVKPSSHGSSIGLSVVEEEKYLAKALEEANKYDDVVIVEEYIRGKEVTVGILDEEPLPVVWLIPRRRFFDYRAKYEKGMTLHVVPAPLPEDTYLEVQAVGLEAHQALGCRDLSRVDMYLDEDQRPIVLEINTIPGFTATSLFPMAALAEGYSFDELCSKLLKLALRRRRGKESQSELVEAK